MEATQEPGAEEDVGMVEHALFQRDDDEPLAFGL